MPNAFPQQPIFVNLLRLFTRIGLAGTVPGVILVHILVGLVFGVWITSATFKSIPRHLEEAARSVGAGGFTTFFRITLVLTHGHTDHIYAYPALLHTLHCMKRTSELLVVCGRETRLRAEALAKAAGLEPEKLTFPRRYSDRLETAGLTVRLLPGRHSVSSSIVKIAEADSLLLYTSDTASFPGIAAAARGCRALVHEATAPQAALAGDPDLAGHSSALQAGENAAASSVESLFLCHLCARLYNGRDPAAEAGRVYGGRIVVPEPFRWYAL